VQEISRLVFYSLFIILFGSLTWHQMKFFPPDMNA
jgi:hypothetical protein